MDTDVATNRRGGRRPAVPVLAGVLLGVLATLAFSQIQPLGNTSATIHVEGGSHPGGTAVDVAKSLGPSVGTVIAGERGNQNGLGSGFVIAHTGTLSYLLTNAHVVSGARSLHVAMPNGTTLTATLVGTDSLDDLAVISIADPDLPVARFGRSSDLAVGETVVAIGSPLGNAGSVTQGVISALHRTISAGDQSSAAAETLQDVLQTDASIDPGNSGGPLADTAGRVVGVNVAFANSAGKIGYSIPSDLASAVAQKLIAGETVSHPYLGIAYLTAIDAVEDGKTFDGPGVLVTQVRAGSPAARAGFKTGDILVAVDGSPIDDGQTLGGLVQTKRVGQTVAFVVKRGGREMTIHATFTERPATA